MTPEEKAKLDELRKKEQDEAEPTEEEHARWIARNRRLDKEEKEAAEKAEKEKKEKEEKEKKEKEQKEKTGKRRFL